MRDTTTIGNRSEGMVLAALIRVGYQPLIPFGGGLRYDLAFDLDGQFKRVQCKTGRLVNGVVAFQTANWSRPTSPGRSYCGEVEYFGVYCPDTEEVYLVPIEDVHDRGAYLRVEPTRNGQAKGVRWAKDYVL